MLRALIPGPRGLHADSARGKALRGRSAVSMSLAAATALWCLLQGPARAAEPSPPLAPEGPEPPGYITNARDGYALRYIPEGEFWMGSPDGVGEDNEHPRHRVRLDGYYIGKHEVTVGQFTLFCLETGCTLPGQNGHGDNYPVVNVSHDEATAYCRWAGLRLPTEAEWERAARGGTETEYWWGDSASDGKANFYSCVAVVGQDMLDDASPIGRYPPNPYDLFDTAGNVWEWVADWYAYDYYAKSPPAGPQGPATGSVRVLRGGSWRNPGESTRSAYRVWDLPSYKSEFLGFRCARNR